MSFSRCSDNRKDLGPGHDGKAASAAGQAARERVEASGHLYRLDIQGGGRHQGSGVGYDLAEVQDAGEVEGQTAAGRGHGLPPVEKCGEPG